MSIITLSYSIKLINNTNWCKIFNQRTNHPISQRKHHHLSPSPNKYSNIRKRALNMNELILIIINNVDSRHIQCYMFIFIFPPNHSKLKWQQRKKINHLDIIMMREILFNQRQTFDLAIYTKITGIFTSFWIIYYYYSL